VTRRRVIGGPPPSCSSHPTDVSCRRWRSPPYLRARPARRARGTSDSGHARCAANALRRKRHLDPWVVQTLTDLGARVCGQQHCFIVDGVPLPVCQRCLGLYAGAALTWGSLLLVGAWGCPLPPRPIVALQAAALIAALLGGLHVIDDGPTWRLLCGLWTGHVVVVWLVGGARQLSTTGKAPPPPAWSRQSWLAFAVALPALAPLAWAINAWGQAGWHVWTIIIVLGVFGLALGAALGLAVIARWFTRGLCQSLRRAHQRD